MLFVFTCLTATAMQRSTNSPLAALNPQDVMAVNRCSRLLENGGLKNSEEVLRVAATHANCTNVLTALQRLGRSDKELQRARACCHRVVHIMTGQEDRVS